MRLGKWEKEKGKRKMGDVRYSMRGRRREIGDRRREMGDRKTRVK